MRLLPFERVTFASSLSSEALLLRVQEVVEPSAWLRNPFSTDHKPFEGEIVGKSFKVRRIIHYRNSFLPTVVGQISERGGGSVLELLLRPNPLVIAFMVLWLGFTGLMALAMMAAFFRESSASPLAFVPAGMFLFGYSLWQGGYLFEAAKAKRLFEALASPPRQPTSL